MGGSLSPYVAHSYTGACGNWSSEYCQIHEELEHAGLGQDCAYSRLVFPFVLLVLRQNRK